jgi:hypothetical protein
MLDKKLTRKEFLISILSIGAIFALSKIPKEITNKIPLSKLNKSNIAYGEHFYGHNSKKIA